jgi:hypothetical protein
MVDRPALWTPRNANFIADTFKVAKTAVRFAQPSVAENPVRLLAIAVYRMLTEWRKTSLGLGVKPVKLKAPL